MSTTRTVAELPAFDTGQYVDCEFRMCEGDATLKIHVETLAPTMFRFRRVRWHQFTAVPNCTPEMVQAYFRLVEVDPSNALVTFVDEDTSSRHAYSELHHFRIFLDETGCHEVFAETVDVP